RLLLILFLAVVGLLWLLLPHRDRLEHSATTWFDVIEHAGVWGLVLLALCYIPASIFLVPASLLTLGAGFLFGPGWGTVAV
ncbi:TVP38/TMEM64 family protein, partial [Parvimonas micra]|uniref:hypothetical protein n=1 Tax=Parvimonas micra TaxID=33033 RepID=UPI002B48B3D0